MSELSMEPEVIIAEVQKLGCPFHASDERSTIWLQGYHAGYVEAGKNALASLNKLLK